MESEVAQTENLFLGLKECEAESNGIDEALRQQIVKLSAALSDMECEIEQTSRMFHCG